jgi:hypothetical protein
MIIAPMITVMEKNDNGTIKIMDTNGEEKDVSVDELESYNLGSVAKVKDNKKGEYYVDNWNTPYAFNFGENGGIKEGRIVYNENDDKMHFVYADASGNTREIEVTNDQFASKEGNQPQIQRVEKADKRQMGIERRFLDAKDERKDKKHEDRVEVLGEFLEETTKRHEASKKIAQRVSDKITTTKNTIAKLYEKLETKKSKRKNASNPYTKAGQDILINIRRSEKIIEDLEKEVATQQETVDDIGVTLAYTEDLIANIDNYSTEFKDFIKDLKKDKANLIELNNTTEKNIESLKALIQDIKDFIQASKDVLNKFLLDLGGMFPTVSNEKVVLEDVTSVEDYFSELDPLLNDESAESIAFAGVTLDGIQPKLAELKRFDKILNNATDAVSKLQRDIIARQEVLDKFGEIQELFEKTKKEEEIILTNPEIDKGIDDSQSKSVPQRDETQKDGFQLEARKPDMSVITSGIAPVRSKTNPVGVYADRAQEFGNIFHTLLDEGKKFKARVITLANEHHLIKGLTKDLAQGSGWDYRTTIVIVVTDEDGIPIDIEGNPIKTKTDYMSKGVYQTMPEGELRQRGDTMFRLSTDIDERVRLRDLYIDWREATLKQTELQPLQDVSASFGLLDRIEIMTDKLDISGKKTQIDLVASNAARSSVDSTKLVRNDELEDSEEIDSEDYDKELQSLLIELQSFLWFQFLPILISSCWFSLNRLVVSRHPIYLPEIPLVKPKCYQNYKESEIILLTIVNRFQVLVHARLQACFY